MTGGSIKIISGGEVAYVRKSHDGMPSEVIKEVKNIMLSLNKNMPASEIANIFHEGVVYNIDQIPGRCFSSYCVENPDILCSSDFYYILEFKKNKYIFRQENNEEILLDSISVKSGYKRIKISELEDMQKRLEDAESKVKQYESIFCNIKHDVDFALRNKNSDEIKNSCCFHM